jgi:hypothetical protein
MIRHALDVVGSMGHAALVVSALAMTAIFPLSYVILTRGEAARASEASSAHQRTFALPERAETMTVPPSQVAPCDIPQARDLWGTCDPVPRTRAAWDEALVSGRAGFVEIFTNPGMRVKIDGRDYGFRVAGGTEGMRLPIAPGDHTLDLISDAYAYGKRIVTTVRAGETERVAFDLRDVLPPSPDRTTVMPVPQDRSLAAGNPWYQGATNGRPVFSNLGVPDDNPPRTQTVAINQGMSVRAVGWRLGSH